MAGGKSADRRLFGTARWYCSPQGLPFQQNQLSTQYKFPPGQKCNSQTVLTLPQVQRNLQVHTHDSASPSTHPNSCQPPSKVLAPQTRSPLCSRVPSPAYSFELPATISHRSMQLSSHRRSLHQAACVPVNKSITECGGQRTQCGCMC